MNIPIFGKQETILFRVDSSVILGTGHVMRCLALADWLSERGSKIFFLCKSLSGNVAQLILDKGYPVQWIDGDSEGIEVIRSLSTGEKWDWMIVDHYELDYRWESQVRYFVEKIMVIDDLANRRHDCDVLLDQNYFEKMAERYREWIPKNCVTLLGPRYALLRREFFAESGKLRSRDGIVRRMLVSFGGSDPTDETRKALDALEILKKNAIIVDIIAGGANRCQAEIKARCETHSNYHYYDYVSNMAQMMQRADLMIGAGGTTTWERCYMALPSLTIVVADNQRETTQAVAKAGATINLGWHEAVTPAMIVNALKNMMSNSELLQKMSCKARKFIE
ncbi:UDP-2 [Sporomusaceae bacterium BoRhaA]|uniref:UDP-2,4-diacetamido-2,4, 6-trideoxy-beta-L-altropyranose hydrolase n=1 Tax=Pelorhabdus rhamnosifermentans TaxID=2772457 RepID=UPI001C06163F|nr:UDP-2,4-diacetamido-2,4,6-trideoxy-beta-L-altropyranose hydrolase [Pelorhabdus rhamnosifermentans]MBU2699163.1 UDP-2 [Pelorhabdus rhamnosifermentans]